MTAATATKPAADKAITLNDATQSLADVIAKSIKVAKDGTTTIDGDIVEANLPPDLTMADIKKVSKYRGQVIAATVDALRQTALPVLGKNKELERVPVSFKFGDDSIDMTLERRREFNDGKGGKLVKHGYVNLGYTAKGTSNSGEFKKARQRLADEAAALLG